MECLILPPTCRIITEDRNSLIGSVSAHNVFTSDIACFGGHRPPCTRSLNPSIIQFRIPSLFILRYVDNLALRQAIEKQLNKVELAKRYPRAVAVGNPREYTQTKSGEQEIAEACNRLIRNSIICWNYWYLARQIEKAQDTETRENLLRLIAAHSPMSWAHINMLGQYDFSEEKLKDTLGVLPSKRAA